MTNLISVPITGGTLAVDQTALLAALASAQYTPTAVVPTPVPTPTPTPVIEPKASPDKTIVTTVGPVITDANGNTWGLNAAAQVVVNGSADTSTSNAVKLEYVSGIIWQENTAGNWYSKKLPTDAWSYPPATVDPLATPAAPVAPTPAPTTTVKSTIIAMLKSWRGKKHGIGQTTEIFSNTRTGPGAVTAAMAPVLAINPATGKDPAAIAVIMNCGNPTTNGAYDIATGKALALEWWAKGGLVQA